MARLNLVLLFLVVACALAVVSSNHRARKLVIEHERELERMRALDVEWGQLQLESSTWAAHARIEQIARERLGMHAPRAAQLMSVEP